MRNLGAALLLLVACDTTPSTAVAGLDLDVRRCKPGAGTTGSPQTIAEAIALANALPQPATAACFLEALDRPLAIEASKSRASAQPADGERSPRVFLFTGDTLVITAAVGGKGRDLIEFGETVAPGRSVKGEIEFPLTNTLTDAAPFDRIRNPDHGNITTCFVCHDSEDDEPGFPNGRSSLIVRPRTRSLVPLTSLQSEFESCDPSKEPERCAMLTALVAWGPLEHRGFDKDLPVF
jgi:hypothetical protein